jgi:hypothetical protein
MEKKTKNKKRIPTLTESKEKSPEFTPLYEPDHVLCHGLDEVLRRREGAEGQLVLVARVPGVSRIKKINQKIKMPARCKPIESQIVDK